MSEKPSTTRGGRRGLMLLAALIASVVTFAVGGGVALAHHSELEVGIDCSRTVTWTATAWNSEDPDRRTNNSVDVWYVEDGSTTKVPVGHGSYNIGNGFHFSGTFQYPASNPDFVRVFAQEQVGWGPNEDLAGIADPPQENVYLPGDCPPPPSKPSTSIAEKCTDGNGTVTVTLTNSGGTEPITFTVTAPGGVPADHIVQANSSETVTFTDIADTPEYKVTITANGNDYSKTIAVNCDRPGTPKTSISAKCTDGNGTVTVTLQNTAGELPVTFNVSAPNYPAQDVVVAPLSSQTVTIENVADTDAYKVTITANGSDFSQTIAVNCDRPGTGSATAVLECSDYDGKVTVTLTNSGGDLDVEFVVNGITRVVAPGATDHIVFSGLADGPFPLDVTIDGVPTEVTVPSVNCDAVLEGTPICNEVDTNGQVVAYWYKIENPQAEAISFTWADGSATVPGHGTINVKSAHDTIDLVHHDSVAGSVEASDEVCGNEVHFEKKLLGQPPTGETYSIRVSRLVGPNYVEALTFNIDAGIPKTFVLPSTIDPAGITYKVEEVVTGTSVTHAVSPDTFTLTGNLGETVDVVITNGYAAVQIDKQVSATKITAGDQLTYTLVAKNTGGLTLHPVVITDLFPPQEAVVSATVAGNAGDCVVVRTTRPQLLQCTMSNALPVGASTPVITIVVKTDDNTPNDATLLNQSKVLGTYQTLESSNIEGLLARPEADEALSCLPVVAGTVCDLSAKVGTLVQSGTESESPTVPPPPAPATPTTGILPVTGASSLGNLLAIAFVLVSAGFVLVRRRRPNAG